MVSKKYIVLVAAGVAVTATAVFFAQKYLRLYFDYRELAAVTKKEQSFGDYLKNRSEAEKQVRQSLETQEAAIEALRQDTVGGKTPEETLAGFVDALKNRDFDLASRYMILKEQESFRKELDEHEKKGEIDKMVGGLENASAIWKEDTNLASSDYKSYYYAAKVDNEDVTISIEFKLNFYSNVWKIVSF